MDIGVAEIATALEGTLSALLGIRLVEARRSGSSPSSRSGMS